MLLKSGYRPGVARDGQLRLPHRAPDRSAAGSRRVGHQLRDAELHAGALRRARARDGAHAVRGAARRRRRASSAPRSTSTTHGGWDSHVLEFLAIGTSVLPIETHEPPPDAAARDDGQRVCDELHQRSHDRRGAARRRGGFEPVELVHGLELLPHRLAERACGREHGARRHHADDARTRAASRSTACSQQAAAAGADGIVGHAPRARARGSQRGVHRDGHRRPRAATGDGAVVAAGERRAVHVRPLGRRLLGARARAASGRWSSRSACASTTSRTRRLGQWFGQVGQNVEMPAFTQGLYDARELAMEPHAVRRARSRRHGGLVGVDASTRAATAGTPTSSSSSPSARRRALGRPRRGLA